MVSSGESSELDSLSRRSAEHLREALYRSRNLVSIRLLRDIGIEYALDYIERFGFDPATSQRSDEGEHSARFKLILESSDPRVEAEVHNQEEQDRHDTQPDAAGNPANHIHCVWRDMRGDFAIPINSEG